MFSMTKYRSRLDPNELSSSQPSFQSPSHVKKGRSAADLRNEKLKTLKKEGKQENKWETEGWMLVPLDDYKLIPMFPERESLPTSLIHRHSSRLHCFWNMWTPKIWKKITKRENVSDTKYWTYLAQRIYFQGCGDSGKPMRNQWPLPDIFSKQHLRYNDWSRMHTHCVCEVNDFLQLSADFSAARSPGDRQSADEKQQKCKCCENPLVSLVLSKKNAPVGIWYFQTCCRCAYGQPYITKLRPAKIMKGDKGMGPWVEWLFADVPEGVTSNEYPVTFCDSLYACEETINEFISKKRIFSFSLSKDKYSYVQSRMKYHVSAWHDYAVAWSQKLGLAITMYYDPSLGKRKCVISNGYKLQKQSKSSSSYSSIPPDLLSKLVKEGSLPEIPPSREFLKCSILREKEEKEQGKERFILYTNSFTYF
jgi:hypothetical protein